jgi:nucleotide-binding universal stress UspA family protein
MAYEPLEAGEFAMDAGRQIAAYGADALRRRHPGTTVEANVLPGPAGEVLAAAAHDAELLVLGSRSHGAGSGNLLGSVVPRALAQTSCPVMVVRGTEHTPRGAVLAAVDIDDVGDALLNFAFTEAAARSAHLSAIYAADLSRARMYLGDTEQTNAMCAHAITAAQRELDQVLRTWQARYPAVRADRDVLEGTVAPLLIRATTSVDVAVTGAHRYREGLPGVHLGAVAHTLLQHAACPVVVVPWDR